MDLVFRICFLYTQLFKPGHQDGHLTVKSSIVCGFLKSLAIAKWVLREKMDLWGGSRHSHHHQVAIGCANIKGGQ